jgi:nitrate reductase assembly molybdenum cofactor insertion protein NarJ
MTAEASALDTRQLELLREAAEWRLAGLLLECPREGWRREVAELGATVADEDLSQAATVAQEEASEGIYHSVFGPGGPAPPRAVSYRESLQPGHLLSELAAFYDAFAYRLATGEPGDHVSVEAGFLAYLRVKEAYALACGDREHAQVTAEAALEFQREHLSPVARPVARALEAGTVEYLRLVGSALLRRLGPETRPQPLHVLTQPTDGDSVFGCGEDE